MEKVKGLILTAGKSSRMGEDKALIKINGEYNILRIIDKIKKITDEIVIVTSQDNFKTISSVTNKLKNVSVVINENSEWGMFSSLKRGINEFLQSDYILMQPVDNMFVPITVYYKLRNNLNDSYDFIKPYIIDGSGKKRGGHPIIITKKGIKLISNADIFDNLKDIMRKSYVKFIKVDNYEITLNINKPEELKKYLEKYNGDDKN